MGDEKTFGRFISEDPIRFAGGMNFYAYVGNNPTTFTDPFGLKCTYSQGSGSMSCTDDKTGKVYYSARGYAGTGVGCVTGSPSDIKKLNVLIDAELGSTLEVVK